MNEHRTYLIVDPMFLYFDNLGDVHGRVGTDHRSMCETRNAYAVYDVRPRRLCTLAFAKVDLPLWMKIAAGPFHTSFDERRGAFDMLIIFSPHDELVEERVCEQVRFGAMMCEQHEPPDRSFVAAAVDHRIVPVIHGHVRPAV